MFRKVAIAAIAVMFVFSADVQAQRRGGRDRGRSRTDRTRTVRTPSSVRVRVNRSNNRRFDNRRFDNCRSGSSLRLGRSGSSLRLGRSHHNDYGCQHQYREWVQPIYEYHEVDVWVPAVYRTVHDDCHHASIRISGGGLGLQIGGCEGQSMLVSEGYHEIRTVRYVAHEGYYRARSSCLSCGHARIADSLSGGDVAAPAADLVAAGRNAVVADG